jgi:hypothetical protein
LAASALSGVALLAVRRQGGATTVVWLTLAALLSAGAIFAVVRARRHFLSIDQALLRLDGALHLRCRLVSAAAGVGDWPAPPDAMPAVFRLRRSRVLTPVAFAAALLVVGVAMPVSRPAKVEAHAVEPPAAWREVDEWLRDLKQESLVSPEAVQEWEERLHHLHEQPQTAWYGHGSLEAGDTLHQQVEASLRTLGEDLDTTADTVELMESVGGQTHSTGSSAATEKLDRAVKKLAAGPVPLDPQLLSQLKAAAATKPSRSPSLEEIARLKRRLREGSGFCKLKVGTCKPGDPDCLHMAMRRSRRIRADNDDDPNRAGGSGGGTESAPLTLDEKASRTGSSRLEGVANEDLQHAALGDTIGMSSTAHEVDHRAYHGLTAGGAASAGNGGETVWRDAWTPEEERVLQRYFQ